MEAGHKTDPLFPEAPIISHSHANANNLRVPERCTVLAPADHVAISCPKPGGGKVYRKNTLLCVSVYRPTCIQIFYLDEEVSRHWFGINLQPCALSDVLARFCFINVFKLLGQDRRADTGSAVIDAALLCAGGKAPDGGLPKRPPPPPHHHPPNPGQPRPQGAAFHCPQVFTFTSRLSEF